MEKHSKPSPQAILQELLVDTKSEFDSKVLVHLKPVDSKIANRARVLTGSTIHFYPLYDKYGKPKTGHTEEELKHFKELKIDSDFWNTYFITIPSIGKVYDLTEEKDRFELKYLLQYPNIAKSSKEVRYETLFYIYDELETAKEKNVSAKKEFECMKLLWEFTNAEKIDFLTLYGHETRLVNVEVAENRLVEEIRKNPNKFLEFVKTVAKTQDLIDLNLSVEYRVIRKDHNAYYYGDIIIGLNQAEALKFLSDPNNQKLKISIKNATATARKA